MNGQTICDIYITNTHEPQNIHHLAIERNVIAMCATT